MTTSPVVVAVVGGHDLDTLRPGALRDTLTRVWLDHNVYPAALALTVRSTRPSPAEGVAAHLWHAHGLLVHRTDSAPAARGSATHVVVIAGDDLDVDDVRLHGAAAAAGAQVRRLPVVTPPGVEPGLSDF